MQFALLFLCFGLAGAAQDLAADLKPLLETGNTAYMKGDYVTARESLLKAWEMAQQMPPDAPERYDLLKRLTSVRTAEGEFADADKWLQMAINWRENALGMNDPKVADDLLISVGLARGLKDFDRAQLILGRVMRLHGTAYGPESIPVADDYSRMAQVYMEQKKVPAAIFYLNTALNLRGKLAGPLDITLVPELDRLAGAHLVQREYDKAEGAYRRAMVIRETLFGKDNADLIGTVDGLAYALFGQKKYDDAEPVYARLVSLWVKSVGDDHPMVAMALDKVAVFYATQKKYEQAREPRERAIALRARFLVTGLSLAAAERTEEGESHKEEVIAIYKRALAVMEPPHPVYEDLRGAIGTLVKDMQAPLPPPAKTPPKKK